MVSTGAFKREIFVITEATISEPTLPYSLSQPSSTITSLPVFFTELMTVT